MVAEWFSLSIFGVLSEMNVDPVLSNVMIARIAEGDWAVYPNQDWFPYNFQNKALVVLPAMAPVVRHNGTEVRSS